MDTVVIGPELTVAPGSYSVAWELQDETVTVKAERLKAQSGGGLQARVHVVLGRNGSKTTLEHSQLNLAAGRSREELSRRLENRYPLDNSFSWDQLIEQSCHLILTRESQGEPAHRLQRVNAVEVEYLLHPVLISGLPSVIFAPGGNGKSLVGMLAALLLQNGLTFEGGKGKQASTLYLDYESDLHDAARRATLLAAGLERTHRGLHVDLPLYRRCSAPLADELGEVAKVVAENHVGLVVVDSLAPAARGDLNATESTLAFFGALRAITQATNAASLINAHVNKQDKSSPDAHRSPYGSVFVENLARATFELRGNEDEQRHNLTVSLLPRKWNVRKPEPLGLQFDFGTEATITRTVEAEEVRTQEGATRAMILEVLESGPASPREISAEIGITPNAVYQSLLRMGKAGLVAREGRGKYRLVDGNAQRQED